MRRPPERVQRERGPPGGLHLQCQPRTVWVRPSASPARMNAFTTGLALAQLTWVSLVITATSIGSEPKRTEHRTADARACGAATRIRVSASTARAIIA